MAPIIYYLGRGDESMQEYYKPFTVGLPWTTFLDLIGWEFFFRGWILFTYVRKFGHDGLWLQAVPFALAHIGKPDIETLSTIFGGFAFGFGRTPGVSEVAFKLAALIDQGKSHDEILAAFAGQEGQTEPAATLQSMSLDRVEWEHINRVLLECGGNVSEAARLLGLHRRTLQRKLSKYPAKR
jgi:DNA-binding protein Fis